MKEMITLTRIELINLLGLNVYRHVKDPADKKRRTMLFAAYLLIAVIFMVYIITNSYSLVAFGVSDGIPMLFPLMGAAIALVFGAFKAKGTIYRTSDLDLMTSLPVRNSSVVLARMLRVYADCLLLCTFVYLPAALIYCIFAHPGIGFYASLLPAILFLPVIPAALTAWFGLLVAWITSHSRHKVLAEVLVMIIIVIGTFLLPVFLSGKGMPIISDSTVLTSLFGETSDEAAKACLTVYAQKAFSDLTSSFPLLGTLRDIFGGKNLPGLVCFGLISVLMFAATVLVLKNRFFVISRGLLSTGSHTDYRMTSLHEESLLKALIRKEAKRYFASGIYVSNTIISPILVLIFAVSLAFWDPATALGAENELPFTVNLPAALPFLMATIYGVMPVTSSSVSIEGKSWWLLKSLPVPVKSIYQAKLAFNLLLLVPFYLLSEIVLLFTVHTGVLERLWFLLAPAAVMILSVVFGLFANLKFPKLKWETEMEVVKQSAAAGLSMLGLFSGIVPALILMFLPALLSPVVTPVMILLIAGAAYLLYGRLMKLPAPQPA